MIVMETHLWKGGNSRVKHGIKNILMAFLCYLIISHFYAEESGDLQKQSLETSSTTNVSTEDVQPVETVNDIPKQVTATSSRPKYR